MLFLFYLNTKIYSNLEFPRNIIIVHNSKKNLSLLTFIEFQHNFSILFYFYSEDIKFTSVKLFPQGSCQLTEFHYSRHYLISSQSHCRLENDPDLLEVQSKFLNLKIVFRSRKVTVSGWLGAQQKARWFIIWLWLALSGCFTKIVKEVWILQSPEIFIIQ